MSEHAVNCQISEKLSDVCSCGAAPKHPPEPLSADWLIWSNEHGSFWRPKAAGYTIHIEAAGRYTETDADKHCATRDRTPAQPLPEIKVPAPEVLAALRARLERCEAERDEYAIAFAKRGALLTAAEARLARCEEAQRRAWSFSLARPLVLSGDKDGQKRWQAWADELTARLSPAAEAALSEGK